jgi:site-specific DNA recombinase
VCLPDRYDDGGFTGSNVERPALKRLLADIEDGKVDCIVVYKVDRLSRSLIDFSKIVGIFERHSVDFVSVTQQFNTSTSMGRLMLNVLLSFAQFEREIISERTRDKITATRHKGKWTGGMPMLGYDVDANGGRLNVNEDEAVKVREIFEVYLERQSLIETTKELDRRGWTTKSLITKKGNEHGGRPWGKNNLYNLLTKRIYLGKITISKSAMSTTQSPFTSTSDQFVHPKLLIIRRSSPESTIPSPMTSVQSSDRKSKIYAEPDW